MRLGVIGLGSIGLRHIKNIKNLGIEVVGYDIDKKKLSDLRKLNIEYFNNKKKFYSSIDAGIIASPSEYHLREMSTLIDNNKHCFVEKPMSHELIETSKLINLAKKKKLIIQVGHNLRFNPAVKFAKELINNHKIGEILWSRSICSSYLPSWRKKYDYLNSYTNKKKSGGVIFDLIHEIDLVYHLFGPGKILNSVTRNSKTLGLKVEDIANITIQHNKGHHSNLHLDFVTRPKKRITEIAGVKGKIVIDIYNRKVKHINTQDEVLKEKAFKTEINIDYLDEIYSFYKKILNKYNNDKEKLENLNVLKLALEARKLSSIKLKSGY